MPRTKRQSLPPKLPGAADASTDFEIQVPSRKRVVSGPTTSNVRFTPYPSAPGNPPVAGGVSQDQPSAAGGSVPPGPIGNGNGNGNGIASLFTLPSLVQQVPAPDLSLSDKDASFESVSPPSPSSLPVPLMPLADTLPIAPRRHFVASAIERHIRVELAGALGSTTIGVGDLYAPLLRVLVPEPYDNFGTPSVRSVFQTPITTLLHEALKKKGLDAPPNVGQTSTNPTNGDHKPPVQPTTAEHPIMVQSAQARHYTTHRPGPSRILIREQSSPMAAAFSTINDWGGSFGARAAWATERLANGSTFPRAALVVGYSFDMISLYKRNASVPPPGPPSEAFRKSQFIAATNLIAQERAIRAREALALAVGHAVLLKQSTGHGFGVAVVGSRFSRVAILSDTVAVVELGLVMPAAFTIVNALSHCFDDRVYERLPNNLTNLPDRMAEILCTQTPPSSKIHFDEAINATALQRFLDLQAAAHAVAEPQARVQIFNAQKPVHDAIINAANNHPAPSYYFPNGVPRHDVGAVWALQLARIVVAEVPPDLFDRLLREMTGAGEPVAPVALAPVQPPHGHQADFVNPEGLLPTPSETAPNTSLNLPIPLPEVNRERPALMDLNLPPLNLDPDPKQSSWVTVDPFTGNAQIVTSPIEADSPSPAEKVSRRTSFGTLMMPKEPTAPKAPMAPKAPKVPKAPKTAKVPKAPKAPKESKKPKAAKVAKEPKEPKTRKASRKSVSAAPPEGTPPNGVPLNGLPLNSLPLNGLPLEGTPLEGTPLDYSEQGPPASTSNVKREATPAPGRSPSPHHPTPIHGEMSHNPNTSRDYESEEI